MEKKESNDLVSVIILTYKKFGYLYEALGSVLCQTYPNLELIICDDGSNNFPYDDIVSYIDKNKKNNIKNYKIVVNDNNVGTVRNYNKAITIANGKYIVGLAGDDVFYEEPSIEKIVNSFQVNKCDVLGTRRMACDTKLKPQYFLPHIYNIKRIYRLLESGQMANKFITFRFYNFASGSALYFKRSYLEEIGYFDTNYVLWEDGPMIYKLLLANKLFVDYKIVTIKYRLGGISSKGVVNEILKKDSEKFCSEECFKHLDGISNKFDKRIVLYNAYKIYEDKKKNMIWRLSNPGVLFKNYMYKMDMFIGLVLDKILIFIRGIR